MDKTSGTNKLAKKKFMQEHGVGSREKNYMNNIKLRLGLLSHNLRSI